MALSLSISGTTLTVSGLSSYGSYAFRVYYKTPKMTSYATGKRDPSSGYVTVYGTERGIGISEYIGTDKGAYFFEVNVFNEQTSKNTRIGPVYFYVEQSSKPTYSLNYHQNYGTGGVVQTDTVELDSWFVVREASSIQLTRPGYTFAGWNTNPDGTGVSYTAGASYYWTWSYSMTLYAQWTSTTVSYSYEVQVHAAVGSASYTLLGSASGQTRSGYFYVSDVIQAAVGKFDLSAYNFQQVTFPNGTTHTSTGDYYALSQGSTTIFHIYYWKPATYSYEVRVRTATGSGDYSLLGTVSNTTSSSYFYVSDVIQAAVGKFDLSAYNFQQVTFPNGTPHTSTGDYYALSQGSTTIFNIYYLKPATYSYEVRVRTATGSGDYSLLGTVSNTTSSSYFYVSDVIQAAVGKFDLSAYNFQQVTFPNGTTHTSTGDYYALDEFDSNIFYADYWKPAPAVDPILSVLAHSSTDATFMWSKNGGTTGSWYLLYDTIPNLSYATSQRHTLTTEGEITVEGLTPGVTYYFTAINRLSSGDTAMSGVIQLGGGGGWGGIDRFDWTYNDYAMIAQGEPVTNIQASAWNDLISKISEVRSATGGAYSPVPYASAGQPITAEAFTAMRNAIAALAGAGSVVSISGAGAQCLAAQFANASNSLKSAVNRAVDYANGY